MFPHVKDLFKPLQTKWIVFPHARWYTQSTKTKKHSGSRQAYRAWYLISQPSLSSRTVHVPEICRHYEHAWSKIRFPCSLFPRHTLCSGLWTTIHGGLVERPKNDSKKCMKFKSTPCLWFWLGPAACSGGTTTRYRSSMLSGMGLGWPPTPPTAPPAH